MRRPLIFLLIALITGIIAGSFFAFSYYLLLSVLTLILFLLFVTTKNKWSTAGLFLMISFIFVLGIFDIQKQNYFIKDERNIIQYIDKGNVAVEGIVIESPPSLGKVSFQLTSDTK
jgi:c-di-AMP phosphodiesterase-like protein